MNVDMAKVDSVTFQIPFFGNAQKEVALRLAGLKLAANPSVEVNGTEKGGSAKLKLALELPEIFKGLATEGAAPAGIAGVSGELGVAASNDQGVRWGGKVQFEGAWLGGTFPIKSFSVAIDGPPLAFEGNLTFQWDPANEDSKFAVTVGLSEEVKGPFPYVSKLALQASGINKPIVTPPWIFLQRAGAEFASCKDEAPAKGEGFQFSGNAGISLGPKIKALKGIIEGEPVSLDGKLQFTGCDPMNIEASGTGKVFDVQVGQGSLKYFLDKNVASLSGVLDLTLLGQGVRAEITKGDISATDTNIEGTAQIDFLGFSAKADAILSNVGYVLCVATKGGTRWGVGHRWEEGVPRALGSACDVAPFRVATRRRQAGVSGFSVPKGSTFEMVAVRGPSAPPNVVLRSPAGAVVPTELRDAAQKTTYFVLDRPVAGAWTVTPLPGESQPLTVALADALPRARVRAVVRGAGARRVLSWSLIPRRGQVVEFVEHGAGTLRVLGRTSRAQGRLRFTPDRVGGRRRSVVARVLQDGLPRTTLVVARFIAPAPPRLGRVRGLALHGTRLVWRAQRGARSYSVAVRFADGSTRSAVVRSTKLALAPRARRGVRVAITALGADGRPGPLATKRFKAGRRRP
jgi:hypothetical protein